MKYSILFSLLTILVPTFARTVGDVQTLRSRSPRIIGGVPATAGQFPSAAAIYVSTTSGTYFCGGTLISQQFVLTAAHCIQGGVAFQVFLGSNLLTGTDPNRVTLSTSIYMNHPDFNPATLENDIGLIKFHLPIEYTDYIQKANLPTAELLDGLTINAIGWGSVSDSTAGLSNVLNHVVVTNVANTECQLSYSTPILDTMVCVVGNLNEGSCRGDSGSPLIVNVAHHHWVTGVASFISTNGCETSDPSGYTRTYPYYEWIKSTAGIP